MEKKEIAEIEWQTRKNRIDTRLKALNPPWSIVRYEEGMDTSLLARHAVEEFPTANGPADYAFFVDGKLLGILEAKKVSLGPQNVLEQAKRYSKGCDNTIGAWGRFKVPFLYASNGTQIWFADVREETYYSREILDFHTCEAFKEMLGKNPAAGRQWLKSTPNEIERLRPYQKDAIYAIEKTIIEYKRLMLLAMATGTGKTFTMVSSVYRLLKSQHARRVLFLVDRRALEAALENFAGCVLVISHDRWFLDRIATHILAFEGDTSVRWFFGNYTEYEEDRKKRLGTDADQPHRAKYRQLTR